MITLMQISLKYRNIILCISPTLTGQDNLKTLRKIYKNYLIYALLTLNKTFFFLILSIFKALFALNSNVLITVNVHCNTIVEFRGDEEKHCPPAESQLIVCTVGLCLLNEEFKMGYATF